MESSARRGESASLLRPEPSIGRQNQRSYYQDTQRPGSRAAARALTETTVWERCQEYLSMIYAQCPVIDAMFWSSLALVFATALERVTFKMMIDRMLPYKFVLAEIIFLMGCGLFSAAVMLIMSTSEDITRQMWSFPHSKIFTMAVLDCLQFLLLIYSAAGVSPTMTVILMHTSTLFVVLGSRVIFPQRKYGLVHIYGVLLISGAILLSMVKIIWNDSTHSSFFATKSALVYVFASCLQGVSTLYKEKSIVEWSQPIDIYYLTAWLFWYQFITTIAIAIIFYLSETIGGHGPSMQKSLYYGWMCFLGYTPPKQDRDDDMELYVTCSDSLLIITGYVMSTFGVIAALNAVLKYRSHTVNRLLAYAIFTAFLVLWIYDLHVSRFQRTPYIFGGRVGLFDLLSLIILLVGMEVYGKDPEPDVELITNYSPVLVSEVNDLPEVDPGPERQFKALQALKQQR